MLFKRTLKVVSATALWMVALLGANSAMAQAQNLVTGEPATYSAETLSGPGPIYPVVIESANTLVADFTLEARAKFYLAEASADSVHIRIAGSGVLRFGTTNPTVNYLIPDADGTDSEEGPNARVDLGAEIPATDCTALPAPASGLRCDVGTDVTAAITGIRVTIGAGATNLAVTGPGGGGITVGIYDERVDAHFAEGTPYQSSTSNILQVKSSVTPKGVTRTTPYTATATSLFTMLKEYSTPPRTAPFEVPFGGFDVQLSYMHLDAADGTVLGAAADEALWKALGVNGSSRFQSPGGWAFASGFRLSGPEDDCTGDGPDGSDPGAQDGDGAGITSSPLSEKDATDDVMGGLKVMPWVLCVTVSNENDEEIPAGSYTVDINLTRATGDPRPFPPTGKAGIVTATVRHDGTRVQIPFVTSYDGYTQRIVIVNRNKVDVGYTLTFRAEGDGEIEGDNPHTGMAMGDQATVVKVGDVVTLTGPTRASATLTVAAENGTVDVATTMVNKMDQSTDTVVLTSN